MRHLALTLAALASLALSACQNSTQQPPVKVGILHSLTGTMAVSESALRDVLLMGVDEINKAGGLLGRQLQPVVLDPASDSLQYAQLSEQLLRDEQVAAVFGCWTSVSRKAVLPVVEKYNGLLFYPVQYEGEECSPNIVYTGATPNQQLIPAAEWLMRTLNRKRFFLLGTDYLYPRTANKILRGYLHSRGIKPEAIAEVYTSFDHTDYADIVRQIKAFGAAGDACVLSTINGESNTAFYNECSRQGISAEACPIMAFSVAEVELKNLDRHFIQGHYAARNYFQSMTGEANNQFVQAFKSYCALNGVPGGRGRVVDDACCWAYTGLMLWKAAVEKAKSFDVPKVAAALAGLQGDSPAGFVRMHSENHHLAKKALIGRIRQDGQFDIVYETPNLIEPEPYSPFMK